MVILRCYLFVTGGRNGVEWVASLLWNQWPEWSRMGGRNAVEYANLPTDTPEYSNSLIAK